jgi:sec-independent protein translocase protein TatC
MTAPPTSRPKTRQDFDPDQYRMTVGEHLEELRNRLVLALGGFILALVFCLIFGQRVTTAFCAPLVDTLLKKNLNPQLFYTQLSDPFVVFIEISLICAAAISAPWALYQLWQFVAAGLYPNERRMVTKYAPLSLILLIAGMAFVYFFVLPWTIEFFVDFGTGLPLPSEVRSHQKIQVPTTGPGALPRLPVLKGDPADPKEGDLWINSIEGRIKTFYGGEYRVVVYGTPNLLAPHFTLPDYIDLVVGMLITFGLSFQLPLVVVALVRVGIVERQTLKSFRRYVYFAMAILAAVITPGDVIIATVLLMIPLCMLYELGIWLSRVGPEPQIKGEPHR